MIIGDYFIDDWKNDFPWIWHRDVYLGDAYDPNSKIDGWVSCLGVCNNREPVYGPWALFFEYNILIEEYKLIFGNPLESEFINPELGKEHIDNFLNKLCKLKAFL